MADLNERARVLSALGDPTRLAIVELLQANDHSPDSLTTALGVPGNLLAHHLKVLQSVGVVSRSSSQHDKRRTYVQLNDTAFEGLLPAASPLTAPRILFVCTHNSARSVLADAIWRKTSAVPSASAGTNPAERVNPLAVAAARRNGLGALQSRPQNIVEVLQPGDVVVSVCDSVNEELPELQQVHLHWSIPDPSLVGSDAAFDETVRVLRERIGALAPRVVGSAA